MTPKFHRLRVAEVRRETADSVSLKFDVPQSLAHEYRFAPGQHLALRATVDGDEMRRSYSICSGLDDRELRVAIKQVGRGRFSRWINANVRAGDALDVMTPEGRFQIALDPAHARHYVAFAAGSGITPILSLARSVLAREAHSHFTLVYGNRRQADVMFHEVLQDLKDRYLARFLLLNVFSREAQEVELCNGRIDAGKVRELLGHLIAPGTIDQAFICGPASMIDEVEAALLAAGVPRAQIHLERFGTPDALPGAMAADGRGRAGAPATPDGSAPSSVLHTTARVTLIIDGVRRDVDYHDAHQAVLDAGLAAGLDLPYSCRGGMCCTCRAKLLEGEVRMTRNFALEPHELAAGYVLTCQSVPQTPRVVLSYDER